MYRHRSWNGPRKRRKVPSDMSQEAFALLGTTISVQHSPLNGSHADRMLAIKQITPLRDGVAGRLPWVQRQACASMRVTQACLGVFSIMALTNSPRSQGVCSPLPFRASIAAHLGQARGESSLLKYAQASTLFNLMAE